MHFSIPNLTNAEADELQQALEGQGTADVELNYGSHKVRVRVTNVSDKPVEAAPEGDEA